MALPVQFTALTNATGANLDSNFAALGALTPIPCAVAGTNAVTLTPAASTPTVAAYSNYMMFSGVVATTNSGAVTFTVGSLDTLNAYKDSVAGPVALTGGELIAGNAFTAIYDSALNSGAGGFHIRTSTGYAGGTIGSVVISLNSITTPTLNVSSLASITKLMVGASSSLTRLISGLGTLTYTVTPANAIQDQAFALAGAQVNDSVDLGLPASPPGAGFTGFISAAGTVTVRLSNPTAASLSLQSVTVRATALGFT